MQVFSGGKRSESVEVRESEACGSRGDEAGKRVQGESTGSRCNTLGGDQRGGGGGGDYGDDGVHSREAAETRGEEEKRRRFVTLAKSRKNTPSGTKKGSGQEKKVELGWEKKNSRNKRSIEGHQRKSENEGERSDVDERGN